MPPSTSAFIVIVIVLAIAYFFFIAMKAIHEERVKRAVTLARSEDDNAINECLQKLKELLSTLSNFQVQHGTKVRVAPHRVNLGITRVNWENGRRYVEGVYLGVEYRLNIRHETLTIYPPGKQEVGSCFDLNESRMEALLKFNEIAQISATPETEWVNE